MPFASIDLPAGHRVLHLAEAASTNTEAMRLGAQGEDSGLWVVADRQTAGRGRAGRSWTSLEGNLQASLVLRLYAPPHRVAQLALVSGVAVHGAIRKSLAGQASIPLHLKWPNDVLLGGAKAGGILIESSPPAAAGDVLAIVGFGLNLAAHPDFPDRPATHVNAHGAAITPPEMLAFLAASMQEWLNVWDTGAGFQDIRTAWLARSSPLGGQMTIHTGAGRATGAFAGLSNDGALLLTDSAGRTQAYSFGDVSIEG